MSFNGTSPLVSSSEFNIAHTFFATVTVGGGQINYSSTDSGADDAIFVSTLSGLAVDNSYVAVNYSALVGNTGNYYIWPGFIDTTAANNYFALQIDPNNPLVAPILKTFVAGVGHDLAMTVTASFSGIAPTEYALAINGTIATAYGYVGGSWVAFANVDATGYVTTVLLETLSAGMIIIGGNVVTQVQADQFFWGPSSALTSTIVPDVIGDLLSVGETAISGAGLVTGTITYIPDPSMPATTITAQSPVGGTVVVGGSAVNLTAVGYVVPDLYNVSQSIAASILAGVDLVLGSISYQPDAIVIAGNVDAQSPAAGTLVGIGSAVNITLSSGLPSLRVPDLFGLTQADAITLLESLGLVVGAIGSQPSAFVPPGEVQLQNPSAGTPVAAGSIVSFVLSLGTLAVGTEFNYEATVISQYANSPTLIQLVKNLNQYIDQSANMANFFNNVWNVDTAVGFGLDIWGKIVGVSRLLHIPTTVDYVGFDNSATPPPDWQTMGSNQPPQPAVGGAMYTGYNATQSYLLPDDAYRQLILAKAFANICTTSAPAINTILQNLYGPGTAWVLNTGPMSISYNLNFTPTAIQLAILEQSGVIPTPPGVSVVVNQNV